MSVKENIEVIKGELKSEEKFLEGAIKVERFAKKYKNKLIFGIALVIGLVGYNITNSYIQETNLTTSNEAYLTLLQNPNNNEALKTLKEKNANLYELYLFSTAIKNNDKTLLAKKFDDKFFQDIATYQLSVLENKPNDYTSTSFNTQQDLALVLEAYKLIKNGEVEAAHKKLAFISIDSALGNVAKSLLHYK